tara:strand:- start:1937 stop:2770 length:834 start_codon:yes stop_codon:yes gene_type:complete
MTDSLKDYYRHKEIYVKLPTEGKWYTSNLNVNSDNEIGVMPMNFKDEMLLSVPDSVYNGESLFEILKSILPDMEDPYEILMPDVDIILLASKINSNDGEMNVEAVCTHCQTQEQYSLKIVNILNQIKPVNPIELELENGLIISFKPNSLKSMTANQIKVTEMANILSNFDQSAGIEQQRAIFSESVERSAAANLILIADTIEYILLPSGEKINDINPILDWINNSDSIIVKKLQDVSKKMNDNGINKEFKFECSNEKCGQQFTSEVEFNPTFFFTNN